MSDHSVNTLLVVYPLHPPELLDTLKAAFPVSVYLMLSFRSPNPGRGLLNSSP